MWPECQGTLSHAPFLDFLVVAMERRRTAVRAEILYTSLYIVFHLSQASLELYIYTSTVYISYTSIHPIHLYILYIIHPYTLSLWVPKESYFALVSPSIRSPCAAVSDLLAQQGIGSARITACHAS